MTTPAEAPCLSSDPNFAELRQRLRHAVEDDGGEGVWITRLSWDQVRQQIEQIERRRQETGVMPPLYGVPFAVKDNIDVAGIPTTAGCPGFAYVPSKTATAVAKLQAAGAIVVGKTNLDQFATGLVGTRSPYGACRNPFDARYIAGGSSSGSAVAVARGLVQFALGTDTAGSGRVPAAFTNTVGLKPTRGIVSAAGVFPACRSLDCISVFALTCRDAWRVLKEVRGFDPGDPFSRTPEDLPRRPSLAADISKLRFGVPHARDLRFFGDAATERQYRDAIDRLIALGSQVVEIDYRPFARAAELLYSGPWLAERYAAVRELMSRSPGAMLPVTRQIIARGAAVDGPAVFEGAYVLAALRNEAKAQWERMDVLLLPTTGTIYTIDQVESSPIELNANLGYYTNFVNLMDLCAVAVPNGFGPSGLPAGISLIGPAGSDESLLRLADAVHRALPGATLGATGKSLAEGAAEPITFDGPDGGGGILLAVVGAHLSGEPLNHQLTSRGATLVRTCRTSADYRLYALAGTVPPKPGLVRVRPGAGVAQEVEVWQMSAEAFGSFVAAIPPPLGIGTLSLDDGAMVKGFICEQVAVEGAEDISHYGGWRRFLASRQSVA